MSTAEGGARATQLRSMFSENIKEQCLKEMQQMWVKSISNYFLTHDLDKYPISMCSVFLSLSLRLIIHES
jgi:hypothetical protein